MRTPPVASVAGSGVAYGRPHLFAVIANAKPRAVVYVDGFNVYYAIRATPYRWLNLGHLARLVAGNVTVVRIRYFTARVADRPGDTGHAAKQDIYLQALRTIPELEIYEGRFLSTQVRMAVVDPPKGVPKTVLVHKTEEKGSDVNLATMLLVDAVRDVCDEAIVLSNDSDLVMPIRLTRQELGKRVTVMNPGTLFSRAMAHAATAYRPISLKSFAAAQFPNPVVSGQSEIRRPDGWDEPASGVVVRLA